MQESEEISNKDGKISVDQGGGNPTHSVVWLLSDLTFIFVSINTQITELLEVVLHSARTNDTPIQN